MSRDEEAYALRNTQQRLAPGVFIASRWGAKDTAQLASNGITHVVVAGRELPAPAWKGVQGWIQLQLTDDVSADLLGSIDEAVGFIRRSLVSPGAGAVLVHCSAGRSRSASICIAYIMATQRVPFEEAFAVVDSVRLTCLNGGFDAQLRAYGQRLADEVASRPAALPQPPDGEDCLSASPEPEPETEAGPGPRLRQLRVIFLDCDGVLCNSRSQLWEFDTDDHTLIHDMSGHNHLPLERRCVDELRRVVEATGAVIVLSTAWRLVPSMRNFLVSSLQPLRVIDDTRVDTSFFRRGAEVSGWLEENSWQVESYCILDDEHAESFAMAGLSDRFILTVMRDEASGGAEEGLTTAKADAAIGLLLKPLDNVGTDGGASHGACGRYKCVKRSQVRAGAAMSSAKAGVLEAGEAGVEVVEVVGLSDESSTGVRKTPSWPRSWANFSLF
jgi:hypothetical protein